ncbi:TIGR03118 family protein [Adhaeribacter arboris]|uniref:TIGR03118 family protein n=1 Tax=Adhaeribacter arboris TaxID=2072846 RepID=A0A2T2YLJ6_9BACT|nr:TIGR03118 family protein [Adhaeribacter arboris]PSR56367.1 TIGR03118 family protein [Adhaeribacter arboris]
MRKLMPNLSKTAVSKIAAFSIAFTVVSSGCDKNLDELDKEVKKSETSLSNATYPDYLKKLSRVNLISSIAGDYKAKRVEPKFQNAWGMAFNAGGNPWVNTTNTGLSFILTAEGEDAIPAVPVPSPTAATGGLPTGIVFNATTDFKLPSGNPARFLFCGLDGIISGWAPGGSVKLVDRSTNNGYKGAVYTGLAKAVAGGKNFLYAANFSINKIDLFDAAFKQGKTTLFKDPYLPAGYAPFNIRNLGNKLYVLYAKKGKDGFPETGKGKGYVSIYEPNGKLIKRFASGGTLNAPWGIARVPKGFFKDDAKYSDLKDAILVGNFGDGYINLYTADGKYVGPLLNHDEKPIQIDGLWEIAFPPRTATNVDLSRLYFSAGINQEKDGLFGYITSKEAALAASSATTAKSE